MGAFDDLIPQGKPAPVGTPPNAFSDLVPPSAPSSSNAFSDLVPKPQANAFSDLVPAGQSAEPGMLGSLVGGLFRGAKESMQGVGQTIAGPGGAAPAPPPNDALQQLLDKPFSQGWSDPSWWTAKIGHGIGSSGPTAAGAIAGAGVGEAVAPEGVVLGPIVGAIAGGAGGSMLESIGPLFQQYRAQGLSFEEARDKAMKDAGVEGMISGAMAAVPGGRLLGKWMEDGTKKVITEALVNIFGVQPAIGAAGQAATAAVEDKPLTLDDLLTAYAQNVGVGAAFHAAGAGRRILDRNAKPEDLALPPEATRPEQPKPTDLAATEPPAVETPRPGDLLHTMQERGPIVPDVPVNKLGPDVNSPSISDGLYVNRPVMNAQEIHDWAVRNGVPEPVAPEDMHATQIYSRKAVPLEPLQNEIAAAPERVAPIGEQGAVALHINSPEMQARFAEARAAGTTHDYPESEPHVTLSYNAPGFDASRIAEPMPQVRLGPEIHGPLDEPTPVAQPLASEAPPTLRGNVFADLIPHGAEASAKPIVPDTIDVYHGSPHQFEEFDTSKIGTGEGAQSYGHGLYFAENPDVAQSYADLAKKYSEFDMDPNSPEFGASRPRAPNLYKSQILGHPDEFLDWDKPLSEQSAQAQTALKALHPQLEELLARNKGELRDWPISDVIPDTLTKPESSVTLSALGIKGIRYLDAKSRDLPAMAESLRNDIRDYTAQAAAKDAAGDAVGASFLRDKAAQRQQTLDNLKPPTRNYVVFDAKHAVPIERNGTPIQRVLPSSTAETVKVVDPGAVADGIKQAAFDIGEALEPGGSGGGQKPPSGGGAPPAGGDGGGKKQRGLLQAADRMQSAINAMPNDPLSINKMSWIAKHLTMAQGMNDRVSADHLAAVLTKQAAHKSLGVEAETALRDYGRMSDKDRDQIDKVLEYDRMTGSEAGETPQRTMVADPAAFHGRPWPLQLTKPGETVKLTPKQSKILNSMRGWLAQAWNQLAEAQARRFGYDGPFLTKDADGKFQIDVPAIKREFDGATDKGYRKAAERALGIAQAAAEGGRGGSYWPLNRYGDWTIRVTPKKPVSGTGHPLPNEGWFSKVEAGNDFDSIRGIAKTEYGNTAPRKVLAEVAKLRERFPAKDFDISYTKPEGRLRDVTDMAMVERVLEEAQKAEDRLGENMDPAEYAKLKDQITEKLYQDMLAGFRKPSQNVPGYSPDFKRAIGDYTRQWSSAVANALHARQIDDTYLATQIHRDLRVRKYWADYKKNNESQEKAIYSAAKRVAFMKYLWASPMSAALQVTQTPLITGTQLGGVIGPVRGQAMAHTALARVMAALRVDSKGAKIDPDKIPGLSADERAGLMQAYKEGRVDPSLPKSIGGGSLSDAMRKRFPPAAAIYDIGSSMFNTMDQANRMAAWIAYHRAARLPGAPEMFNRAYGKDALFQKQVGKKLDPVDLANWGVNETQFLSGDLGSNPLMRGGLKSTLFQFQHYNVNNMRLLHKNFTRMGPQGKVAGTMMLMGLAGAAGLGGLPFVNDVEKITNQMLKWINGIDPRIDAKLREFFADSGFAKMMDGYMGWNPGTAGEVIMEGPSRQLTGMDLGRRIGLGNLLPGDTDIYSGVPFLSATVGAAMEAANRYKSGQPIGAAAALLPAGIGNPLKAYGAYPNEGVRQQQGQMVFAPSEVTPGMKAVRALGATPTPIARRQQAMADQAAIKYATDEASKNLLARIAGEYALADDAQTHGDTAGAASHSAAAEGFIQANAERLANADVPDWQQIPTPRATQIRKTIARYLFPMQGSTARNQRMKQEELAASPYLSQ